MPTFGSLFAGIGGIDLGLERAGWECRFQVEWDPFCQRVLAKHWPDVPRYGDITAIDWSGVERVDLLAGGFPCQPVSAAGLRKGQEDDRWLWPEFARAIRVVRPRYVLLENVRNLLAISDGAAMSEIYGDLAALGYYTDGDCIPASAFGAPHERERVWVVAHAAGDGWPWGWWADKGRHDPAKGSVRIRPQPAGDGPSGGARSMADADGIKPQRRGELVELGGPTGADQGPLRQRQRVRRAVGDRRPSLADPDDGDAQGFIGGSHDPHLGQVPPQRPTGLRGGGRRIFWPTQSRVGRAADGVSAGVDGHRWPAPPGPQYDWEPPRTVKGLLPNRAARIKALGNAVVPQVVEWIGRRLMDAYLDGAA